MIVRIEVQDHSMVQGAWELKRCQVQLDGDFLDVIYPAYWRFFRFATLEEAIRHAKKTTFRYLERTPYRGLPEQFDWHIYDLSRPFLCSGCGQPQYRKAKLGYCATTLDLQEWGCPACSQCVCLFGEETASSGRLVKDPSSSDADHTRPVDHV